MTTTKAPPKTYAAAAELAIGWALNHLGLPYLFGGEATPAKPGLDCSGMVEEAWKSAVPNLLELSGHNANPDKMLTGQNLTHYAAWQYYETARIFHENIARLRRGDIVFYNWNPIASGPLGFEKQPGGPGHCAIFVGFLNNVAWVMQATRPGVNSEVVPMYAYDRPIAFGRVRYADWQKRTTKQAVYQGGGLDRKKWARYLTAA